ncbi:MAG: 4-hydroxy-tetrahydrodipicolinate reductase [Draconibacterium sp.]|nr:MAG: 4-hydroxy-tetrahydrodipicolinate reductase [Draconibacterium sp.]
MNTDNLSRCDVAIEFTQPESAVDNYIACFESRVPVVSGTTGWLSQQDEVHRICQKNNGTFFYASNFSVGVNIFFQINKKLATLMNAHENYDINMTEIHHLQKKDAPSGTAITLADDIIQNIERKESWVNDNDQPADNELNIVSKREDRVPGIHTICYESDVDFIEITHSAKSRKGFALGAVLAAEFCMNNQGLLTMNDLLKL